MRKFLSLILCCICAFATLSFTGCDKKSSNGEDTGSTESESSITDSSSGDSSGEEPAALDILEGNFTAITLTELQTFAANIVYTADVIGEGEDGFDIAKEIVANNEGAEFSAESMGDDEGEWDGCECTGKVFNGKGRFFYEGQGGVRGAVVVEEEQDTYCDGETVYEKYTEGNIVEKIKYAGDVGDGIRTLLMEDVPELKAWREREGYVYEYALDETDSEYNKIKMTIHRKVEWGADGFYGAHTQEQTQTVIFAFDKTYKLKAFSYVGKETRTYTDKTWVWDTEYIARPWSGEIQAPEDLSAYIDRNN